MYEIFAKKVLTPEGWVEDTAVKLDDHGRIASVGPGDGARADVRVPMLLPALANLHSHTFQRAMAGLTERRSPHPTDSFWTWRELMYRFLDVLTPEDVETVAAFAFMEMQEAGFAAVAEFHYLHHQPGGAPYDDLAELSGRIAAAAATTGIGLTLLPVLYTYGGVDGRPLQGGQLRFANDLHRFEALASSAERHLAALPPDTAFGIAPHSLRAVGPEDLRAAAALRPEAPVHMHVAEQEQEVRDVEAHRGARPVEWLLDHLDVDRRWCLVHATHLTTDETVALARSGAVAGLCPVTEANLGDGIFNGRHFLAEGGIFGVGSDSNVRISVAEELRQLEYAQRLRERARVVLATPGASCGRTLYEAALAGGHLALGRDSGAIAPGRWADLVALAPPVGTEDAPGDDVLDAWIFTGDDRTVTDVWCAGRHMVADGRHVGREPLAARYARVARKLRGVA